MYIYIIKIGDKYYVGQAVNNDYSRLAQHIAAGYRLSYSNIQGKEGIFAWGGYTQQIDDLMVRTKYSDIQIAILSDKINFGLDVKTITEAMSNAGWV